MTPSAWPAVLAARPDDLPDAALLGRFLADRDEAVFRLLLSRHGPMVLGVCRRVLGDHHDAEDAFQATFLVLARRAADAARDQLGPWLHGIAFRTALKARVAAARRHAHEHAAAKRRPVAIAPREVVADLGRVLDEELARLPAGLRTAVVLCDLEGYSRRQAARQLGLPESTLSSRLTTARRRLADRLTARGVTLSVAGLVASVPAALADRTVSAALGDAFPAPVAALTHEALRAMTRTRKLVAAALIAAAAAVGTVMTTSADDRTPAPPPVPAKAAKLDGFRFLAFDGFDGQFGLNWQVVRPDPAHASLTRHPGRLTVTTQRGSIAGKADDVPTTATLALQALMAANERVPEGTAKLFQQIGAHLTRNLHLIDNPLAPDADFTATTCVVNFDPKKPYQQAGLILYTDDDHYLKWTYEWNDMPTKFHAGVGVRGFAFNDTAGSYPPAEALVLKSLGVTQTAEAARVPPGRPYFLAVGEVGGTGQRHVTAEAPAALPRVWLRVTKRGNLYDLFTSTDGEHFVKHGTADWGKGGPKRIGLLAQNGGEAGGEPGVPEVEAQFEFFELRAP